MLVRNIEIAERVVWGLLTQRAKQTIITGKLPSSKLTFSYTVAFFLFTIALFLFFLCVNRTSVRTQC